jgi:hypothetical protein
MNSWETNQKIYFLKLFLDNKLSKEFVISLNDTFNLINSNYEIQYTFFKIALKNNVLKYIDDIEKFLSSQGRFILFNKIRMKYVRPIYRAIFNIENNGKEISQNIFKKYQNKYHSIAIKMIKFDLQLDN